MVWFYAGCRLLIKYCSRNNGQWSCWCIPVMIWVIMIGPSPAGLQTGLGLRNRVTQIKSDNCIPPKGRDFVLLYSFLLKFFFRLIDYCCFLAFYSICFHFLMLVFTIKQLKFHCNYIVYTSALTYSLTTNSMWVHL